MEIGSYVTRYSHNHDMVFKIIDIKDDIAYLKGLDIRLVADSPLDDLKISEDSIDNFEEESNLDIELNRDEYFYMPGKVVHVDGDREYLNRCLDFYKNNNIWAVGIYEEEEKMPYKINEILEEYNPNILVITGHDAYYKKKGNIHDHNAYKNSDSFVNAVINARKYEDSHEKLIIIAGACQSNYDDLIKAGANFASSPKRINIHSLDPAIIASEVSYSDVTEDIDLKKIIDKTKYGKDGIGGIKTKGTMYIGYPR